MIPVPTLLAETSGFHPALIVPLVAGFLYALSAIMVKKAMQEGIGPWRVTFISNLWVSLIGLFLLFFPGSHWPGIWFLYQPILAGFAFFIGQIFTFLALSRGDVTVATPLMGTKILFVAIFSLLLLSAEITFSLWASAFLAAIAVFLLGAQSPANPSKIGVTIAYALASAASFGLTDVLIQFWAGKWGFSLFLPIMFVAIGAFSFSFVPFFRGGLTNVPRRVWPWLLPGTIILAAQSSALAVVLGIVGRATEVNILYSTRGLFSILLIWFVGHLFANKERHHGKAILLRRFAGAVLLLGAIVLLAV